MSELKFEGKIKTLKQNMDKKESKILSINEVVQERGTIFAMVEVDIKEVEAK